MKNIKFLILGIFFAIVLSKTQAISWYRFYEMFKFQSFHMFGVIGGAVLISMIFMQRRVLGCFKVRDFWLCSYSALKCYGLMMLTFSLKFLNEFS